MQIKGLPGLQIDDFRTLPSRPEPSLCLLTHSHSDHLVGLERKTYYGPTVYCSKATRSMVLNLRADNGDGDLKYYHLRKDVCGKDVFVGLDFGITHKLHCNGSPLEVTLIEANHCPGAAMFLIKNPNGKIILFTGDTRCEAWHVNALQHHPQLLPHTFNSMPISVYVDNTFEQHADPYLDYSNTADSARELLALLDRGYPETSNFVPIFSTTGYEKILIVLAVHFNTKIHMDSYYYSLYMAAADTDLMARTLLNYSTLDPFGARIHWCRKKGTCEIRNRKDTVFFSPCVTISNDAVEERNRPLRIQDFDIGGNCELPVYIDSASGTRYILGDDKKTLLPGHMLFYYSRHASKRELHSLLELFSVRTVYKMTGEKIEALSSTMSTQDSATKVETPKDTSIMVPPSAKTLPMHRKQREERIPPRSNKRAKRMSSSFTSSGSFDLALAFMNGAVRQSPEREHSEKENSQKPRPCKLVEVPGPSTQRSIPAVTEDIKMNTVLQAMNSTSCTDHDSISEPRISMTKENSQLLSPAESPVASDTSSSEDCEGSFGEHSPSKNKKNSANDAISDISPVQQDLTSQLRLDPSLWFSIQFDWQK